MRGSLNRARRIPAAPQGTNGEDYASIVLRAFDDQLEILGATGPRFERWCQALTDKLQSVSHDQYREGLEQLGRTIGYHAWRPRQSAAADCLWRGICGNTKELFTLETKIEHEASQQIAASDIGQAHNQCTRAQSEYGTKGYIVRGAIITHLISIDPAAEASAGSIRLLQKTAILELWNRIRSLLTRYRDGWSLDDISARSTAARAIISLFPKAGWFTRALDIDQRVITAELLTAEWP